MTTRSTSQLALAAVFTGMAVWWFATQPGSKLTTRSGVVEPSSADYRGPEPLSMRSAP